MAEETKKGNSNTNLRKASKAKNDEYYTQLSDIEKELKHYRKHFKDKIVFCNCDDPKESNFFMYFALNFRKLGLKKLVTTHYQKDSQSYKLEITTDINNDGRIDLNDAVKTLLTGDGDFRSEESIEILKESNIVVTNPPFSLFREYIAQLMSYNKSFLVLGNINTISYKESFEFIKANKVWLGYNTVRWFKTPTGELYETARTFWYTNLDIKKRHENLILYKTFKDNENDYPKYDNYDAIEVGKTKDIPLDYDGYMGVPITFMDKYNSEQFTLIGIMNTGEENKGIRYEDTPHGRPIINGVEKYLRILIKNKRL